MEWTQNNKITKKKTALLRGVKSAEQGGEALLHGSSSRLQRHSQGG
jgi:hypothetical protein